MKDVSVVIVYSLVEIRKEQWPSLGNLNFCSMQELHSSLIKCGNFILDVKVAQFWLYNIRVTCTEDCTVDCLSMYWQKGPSLQMF